MAKKEFPEIKEKNEGKFTKWVEKNMSGMDTCKAASKVMRSKTKKYSPAVVKMANYANNFGCKTKKEGASMKDPDIKAAKKQIRKGANVLGGGNIVDDFGHKHGYKSDKLKELDNSRLVQRKKSQYVKQEAKSNIKSYRGKEIRKGFKNDPFFNGKGNQIRKQEIKDLKKTSKEDNKRRTSIAKGNRIIAKAKK
jgi:hypothetical protein